MWDKVYKNGPSKIYGIQPLKEFTFSILEYFVPYRGVLVFWYNKGALLVWNGLKGHWPETRF